MAGASYRLPLRTQLALLLGTLLVALFTFYYSRLVCVAICALPSSQLSRNIALISFGHFTLRFVLLSRPITPSGTQPRSPARIAYLRSVMSWLFAGGIAILLHIVLYPEFPLGSHLKFALGFWVLGGGIVGQLEYLLFEQALPLPTADLGAPLRERMRWRLVEGYVVFTVAPALVLLLTLIRVVGELHGERRHVLGQRCCRWCLRARRSWRRCSLDGACAKTVSSFCWRFSKSDKETSSPP